NLIVLGAGGDISTTEGATFSGTVATFQDPGSPDTPSDFTATIDWGDGTITPGTVTGGGGFFTVTGTHTYTDEIQGGIYGVTVTEPEANLPIGPVGGFVTVAEADTLSPVFVASGPIIENTPLGGAAAGFSDTNTAADPNDFTATI